MTKPDDILYRYTPANEGDNYLSFGIPARDLTAADVARLERRGGSALANLTAPQPGTGKPMYTPAETKRDAVSVSKADGKDAKS